MSIFEEETTNRPLFFFLKDTTETVMFAVEACGLHLPGRSNLPSIFGCGRFLTLKIDRHLRYVQLRFMIA